MFLNCHILIIATDNRRDAPMLEDPNNASNTVTVSLNSWHA